MSSPNDQPTASAKSPAAPRDGRGWSLRRILIASHVALVTIVVAVFGIAAYWLLSRATYRQAESDLLGAAQALLLILRESEDPSKLAIPDSNLDRLGRAPRDRPYFALWDPSGNIVTQNRPLLPHVVPLDQPPPSSGPHPFATRRDGPHFEVIVRSPDGGQLLVGRPLAREFDFIRRLALQLSLTGLGCILLGLVAAWALAHRLAQPLVQMADTAQRVTSRNLDERVTVGSTPRELVQLGQAFNAMLEGLKAAFSRQARFTADASHELRTPVSVVLSQAEHTLARDRTPEEYRGALDTCLRAARRMRTLIDDLLVLARADAGRLELRRDALDLADVARGTVELLQPWSEKQGVRLDLRAEATPLTGDAVRLGQVISNLVTNAVQHSPQGSLVTIETKKDQSTAVLIVSDQGTGISADDQPRLFDRFFRVDRARTHAEGTGTGLGLSLVSEIVAAHGGTIGVRSAPEEGTTMTVRLPTASSVPAEIDSAQSFPRHTGEST